MWLEQPRRNLIEPRLIVAGIGAIVLLGMIVLVTFGVRQWDWFDRPSELDQLVAADTHAYLRFDLSPSALQWWEKDTLREQWTPLVAGLEKELTQALDQTDPVSDVWRRMAGEAAVVQFKSGQPATLALLLRVDSADKFSEELASRVPAQREGEIWRSHNSLSLFSTIQKWWTGQASEPAPVYWQAVKKHVVMVAADPAAFQYISVSRDRKTETMRDRTLPYQPSRSLAYGFTPIKFLLPETALATIQERSARLSEAAGQSVFVEVRTDGRSLTGRFQDQPQSLLERLTQGDAAGKYMEASAAFPHPVSSALIHISPAELLEAASDYLKPADTEQFDWSAFVKQEFGLNWSEQVLPMLDQPADVFLGQPTEQIRQPFVVVFRAENPATAELRMNNIEALFRQVAARLYPREVEKILPDGSVAVELLPDPQTNRLLPWAGNLATEHFLDLPISSVSSIVFGQQDNRIFISNSAQLLRSALNKEGTSETVLQPDCISDLRGQQIYFFDQTSQSPTSVFSRFFPRVWLADGGDANNLSLTFCLPLRQ